MKSPIGAGVRYFLPVFAFAFALGTLRTLLVAPRTGEIVAVLIELPIILAVAWAVCRRMARDIAPGLVPRIVMGATAFTLLIGVEFAMAIWLFDRTPSAWLVALATPAGQIGLAGQIGYALMPLFVRR